MIINTIDNIVIVNFILIVIVYYIFI